MADGSVIIDTKLDQSGLKTGLSEMAGTLEKGLTTALKAASAALVALGGYAIKVGSEFEAGMSQVAATMGDAATQTIVFKDQEIAAIDAITSEAARLGSETAFTAKQAAEGFNILAMSGLNALDQISAMPHVLNLAAAGALSLEEAASFTTGAIKGFGDSFDNTQKYVDIMAKGATLANTNVQDLGAALSYSAATANSYGQTVEGTTLALLRLAEQNVTGEAAATAMNRAMAELYTPTAQAEKALKALGVSAYDSEGKARDFNTVVDELSIALSGMSEKERNAYKNTIFGIQGLQAFNKMTVTATDKVEEFKEGVISASDALNGEGSAAEQAATQLDNLQGDITKLQSAAEGFGNELYRVISTAEEGQEPLRNIVRFATELVNQLHEAITENGLSGLAEALGNALAQAVNKMLEYVPQFTQTAVNLIQALAAGLISASPQIAQSVVQIGMILSQGIYQLLPQLVTLGAELIVALADSVADNLPQVTGNMATGMGDLLKACMDAAPKIAEAGVKLLKTLALSVAQNVPTLLAQALPMILQFTASIRENIGNIVEAGIRVIEGLVEGLVKALPDLIAYVPEIVSTIAGVINDNMPKILQCAINIVLTLIKGLIDNLPNIIANMGKIVQAIIDVITAVNWMSLGKDVLKLLVDGIKALATAPVQAVKGIFETVKTTIQNGFSWSSLGQNIINGIVQGLSSIGDKIVTTLLGLCQNAFSAVKRFFGIASPSKLFRDTIGKNLMLGLAEGIDEEAGEAVEAAEKAAEEITGVNYNTGFAAKGLVNYDSIAARLSSAAATGQYIIGASVASNCYGGHDLFERIDKLQACLTTISEKINIPDTIDANINIDGHKLSRDIVPFMAKDLEWYGK